MGGTSLFMGVVQMVELGNALPMMGVMCLQVLIGMADGYFVG